MPEQKAEETLKPQQDWVVVRHGAVTIGDKVFKLGGVFHISEFEDKIDWLFDQNAVGFANTQEIEDADGVEALKEAHAARVENYKATHSGKAEGEMPAPKAVTKPTSKPQA